MKALLSCVTFLALVGCEGTRDSKTAAILSQVDSVNYELALRRSEIEEMEKVTRKPGVVGVSNKWLQRRNELKEKIITLEVRRQELIAQLPPNLR